MSGSEGQAAGLAVGAAVGAVAGGPAGAVMGASVGAGIGGGIDTLRGKGAQTKLERETLKLNQEQAHAKAADASARHAATFRQALASQVSKANMRGGSGSIAMQIGTQAMDVFQQDERAIEAGVRLADVQAAIGQADITAKGEARTTKAIGQALSGLEAVDFNKLSSKKG